MHHAGASALRVSLPQFLQLQHCLIQSSGFSDETLQTLGQRGQISISKGKGICLFQQATAVAEVSKSAKHSLGAVSRVLESTTVLLMLAPHTLMKDRIDPGKLGLIPSSSHCQKQGRKYAQGSMKSAISHVSQAHLITSKQSLRAGVCQDSIKALLLPINSTTGTHTSFGNCSDRQQRDSSSCSLCIGSQTP